MLKKKIHYILWVGLLYCTQGVAAEQMQNRLEAKTYELIPGYSYTFSNNTPTKVTVYCQMHIVSGQGVPSILVNVLQGMGEINGTSMRKGQRQVMTISNLQVISILAQPSAQAEFINLGTTTIKAICS